MHTKILLLLVVFSLHAQSAEQIRLFTDAKGRSVRAAFISTQNGQVTLRLGNGQLHTLSISTLSTADQKWIEDQGQAGAAPSDLPGGMVFSPRWLPQTLTAKRELLESLEFYCKASVGDAPKGQEPIPSSIVGGITWRMPVDEAVKTLPPDFKKISERPMVHPCFPNDSLVLCGFQSRKFVDHGQPFNVMFMLVDKERKVVSVQFVDQNGKNARWLPVPDGIREPYYNLVSLAHNGSTTKEVPYQILKGGTGAVCIKTTFQDKTGPMPRVPVQVPGMPPANMPAMVAGVNVEENVHWYLPAPFARSILDIVDVYRKAGVIR
ncbi:hypothetical protein [Prosthecobacter sp.]|uniref:hypothetical protein n=1 Tax=Prosthecobacter sp. TaxID=1965333 RepID=UPI003783775F